jgi:hypothetical protein
MTGLETRSEHYFFKFVRILNKVVQFANFGIFGILLLGLILSYYGEGDKNVVDFNSRMDYKYFSGYTDKSEVELVASQFLQCVLVDKERTLQRLFLNFTDECEALRTIYYVILKTPTTGSRTLLPFNLWKEIDSELIKRCSFNGVTQVEPNFCGI